MNILGQGRKIFRGILAISKSVGNSRLCLVAALNDLSNAEGVSPKLKTLFMIFNPPNFSLNAFAAKNFANAVYHRKKASQCCLFLNFF